MSDAQPAPPTVPFFRKKTRPATTRRRSPAPNSTDEPGPSSEPSGSSEVARPSRKVASNPLVQGTKRTFSERDGPDVKWKAHGSNKREEAELQLEVWEGEEAQEILKKAKKELDKEDMLDDGLYHGQAAYKTHIKKREEPPPKSMRIGPQRSSNTIKTVTLVDYQPDVCKDYKETGFCGFGDTCKFLHDRGTYLAGWQLDKLAANPKPGAVEEDDSSDEEDIPWACFICRKEYTDPVVTRCSHYFCSACAIKRFGKTPKCAACGTPTGGIFNRADKVIEKMREKERKKKEDAEADDDAGVSGTLQVEGLNEDDDSSSSDDE